MKKLISLVALFLVLSGAFLYFYLPGKTYDVVITQKMIDASLAKRFPLIKKHLLVFTVTYSNPHAILLEKDDRIQVGLDATVEVTLNGKTKNYHGSATVTTGLRYDSETQEFFLADAQIDKLAIQGLPNVIVGGVSKLTILVAKDFIESHPVYRLEAKNVKMKAAKMLLKGVEVKDQALHIKLGI